jgi:hypothetical protein
MKHVTRWLVVVALILALPGALLAADQLTNADIIKLSKANLGDDLIIAKIQQAQGVAFKLETDDIIQLKQAGVHQEVISAMLKRTSAPEPSSGSSASAAEDDDGHPAVSLVAASVTKSLKAIEGDHKQFAAPFVGLRHFLEFDEQHAATRIKDRRPTLELNLGKSPGNHWWLVRLDPDDDDPTRGLDLESAGMYGGAHTFEPDEDFIIETTRTDAGGGVWRFKPNKDLKPGEYALYSEKGFAYDFGVDK